MLLLGVGNPSASSQTRTSTHLATAGSNSLRGPPSRRSTCAARCQTGTESATPVPRSTCPGHLASYCPRECLYKMGLGPLGGTGERQPVCGHWLIAIAQRPVLVTLHIVANRMSLSIVINFRSSGARFCIWGIDFGPLALQIPVKTQPLRRRNCSRRSPDVSSRRARSRERLGEVSRERARCPRRTSSPRRPAPRLSRPPPLASPSSPSLAANRSSSLTKSTSSSPRRRCSPPRPPWAAERSSARLSRSPSAPRRVPNAARSRRSLSLPRGRLSPTCTLPAPPESPRMPPRTPPTPPPTPPRALTPRNGILRLPRPLKSSRRSRDGAALIPPIPAPMPPDPRPAPPPMPTSVSVMPPSQAVPMPSSNAAALACTTLELPSPSRRLCCTSTRRAVHASIERASKVADTDWNCRLHPCTTHRPAHAC